MVTKIHTWRTVLITKEDMQTYCKGLKSINDDLESLFADIRLGKEPNDDAVWTDFSPKLTEEELELIERKNRNYMQTFLAYNWETADLDKAKLKASDSDSIFVRGYSRRTTFTIKKPMKRKTFS